MPELHAIVSVDFAERVRCGNPGCGHSVYRRIHVVQDGGDLLVLGSTCFAKRYGSSEALGRARHGGGGQGRTLTPDERQLLVGNTAALLASFDAERQARLASARNAAHPHSPATAGIATLTAQHQAGVQHPHRNLAAAQPVFHEMKSSPWAWRKPMTSMIRFHLQDGTDWIRVQHLDGQQLLVPWPSFDGWDEALPAHVGTPHASIDALVLKNLMGAVAYLREHAQWERMSGLWREIAD